MRIKILVAVMMLLASQALWADKQTVNKYVVVSDSISQESPMFKKHIQDQAAVLLSLWKKGVIENVYLNRGLNKSELESKEKVNIVFFINAKNKDEANEVLKQLPFAQHKVVNYILYPVGVLWLKQIGDFSK